MGGQALKVAKTRRYNVVEYFFIREDVQDLLASKGLQSLVPKSYRGKPSFGDLDVLLLNDIDTLKYYNVRDLIVELFNPTEIYQNSHIYSFDYKEFQIDIILVNPENWYTSNVYFSYNDLGNFMGRIAYQMGFRYGDYGLKLVYRHEDGGRKFERIISRNPIKIFEFLGFEWNKYEKGFNTVEDIFDFVIESKYFNTDIFQYEQLDHQNRTRNKKRKNYAAFLEYIIGLEKHYTYASKDEYVELAEKFFSIDLRSQINNWKNIVDEQKRASAKFNGNIVMEHFPLQGKQLGECMERFRNYVDSLSESVDKEIHYHQWILNNDESQILATFANINELEK